MTSDTPFEVKEDGSMWGKRGNLFEAHASELSQRLDTINQKIENDYQLVTQTNNQKLNALQTQQLLNTTNELLINFKEGAEIIGEVISDTAQEAINLGVQQGVWVAGSVVGLVTSAVTGKQVMFTTPSTTNQLTPQQELERNQADTSKREAKAEYETQKEVDREQRAREAQVLSKQIDSEKAVVERRELTIESIYQSQREEAQSFYDEVMQNQNQQRELMQQEMADIRAEVIEEMEIDIELENDQIDEVISFEDARAEMEFEKEIEIEQELEIEEELEIQETAQDMMRRMREEVMAEIELDQEVELEDNVEEDQFEKESELENIIEELTVNSIDTDKIQDLQQQADTLAVQNQKTLDWLADNPQAKDYEGYQDFVDKLSHKQGELMEVLVEVERVKADIDLEVNEAQNGEEIEAIKIQEARIEDIVSEAQIVNKELYDKMLLEGGEFCMTKDGEKYRYDFDAVSQKNAENYIESITGLNLDRIKWDTTEPQIIGKLKVECEGIFGDCNAIKIINLNTGQRFNIAWHDEGHPNLTDDANSQKSHYNLDFTVGNVGSRKTINQHIKYN